MGAACPHCGQRTDEAGRDGVSRARSVCICSLTFQNGIGLLRHRKYTRADRFMDAMVPASMYLFLHYGPMNAELNDCPCDAI
jgi:hypothetical protein